MFFPSSTYRIQFNKEFTFDHLDQIIDYLHELGISTIYAAPILKSTKGSVHGYDVTDPHVIDPEIGTLDELREIAAKLKKRGMSWLQDIVPNHMAFDPSNQRLMDVLERGPLSQYYTYFDIDWNHPSDELKGKVLVPFLGNELSACIANKELRLNFTQAGFVIEYFDTRFPVSITAYDHLFSTVQTSAGKKLRQEWKQFEKGAAPKSDLKVWQKIKNQWISSISRTEENTIRKILVEVEADPQKLASILERQHYVLSFWKRTEKEINYRRFFTVNQLICLRMEDESVFNDYHSFLNFLYKENIIQGFRIDHIDGLNDPAGYIQRLRGLFGDDCYIIAEKILEARETIPTTWPLQGTSGYEFLAYVNQLFTDRKGAKQLLGFYKELVPQLPAYRQLVIENKQMMLKDYMAGEWNNLTNFFFWLNLDNDYEWRAVKDALGALLVALPVYRIYPEDLPLTGSDLVIMAEAIQKAKQIAPSRVAELDYFNGLLVSPLNGQKANIIYFLKRMMQFAGPLTAKGVEDTTFYIYNPLISHDEVGDSPSTLGITIKEFHGKMKGRQQETPFSLNATATHDTKRGEDVRVRLNVLSEMPDQWIQIVRKWFEMNNVHKISIGEQQAPTVNDEYFIYQSIVGGFPEDLSPSETWQSRLKEYLQKVVREAKVNSSWEAPNEEYEMACMQFVDHLLNDDKTFLADAVDFLKITLPYANMNALGQILIKITAPGIPDIYQGCELWDLSYVDPDNRRQVDFEMRKKFLAQIRERENNSYDRLASLFNEQRDLGIEKLFVTYKTLTFRRNHPDVFLFGEYVPLQVTGTSPVTCAYLRRYRDQAVMIIIPLALAAVNERSDEFVILPPDLAGTWTNVFTHTETVVTEEISVTRLLTEFPVGFLANFQEVRKTRP